MRRSAPASAPWWRHALLRHLTVLVGVVCLLTQLSSVFHLLVVRHVRCAEHGEWVHEDDEHARTHVSARGEATPDEPAFLASSSVEDHEHEHCLICSERSHVALPPNSLGVLPAPIGDGLATRLGPSSSIHSLRVYPFAPKTSPPV